MTEEARAYLTDVLDYIQRYSVKREQIDWVEVREEAMTLASDARTTADTYPAIRMVLKRLDDHHSYLLDPSSVQLAATGQAENVGIRALYPSGMIEMVFPGSSAEAAGIQIGEVIESFEGEPVSSLTFSGFHAMLRKKQLDLTLRSAGQEPTRQVHLQATLYPTDRPIQGRRLFHDLGYIQLPELPRSSGADTTYIETAHQILQEIDQMATCGWVIDVRHNPGGNVWGMITAVGPILEEEEWTAFVGPEVRASACYRNGQAISNIERVKSRILKPYELKRPSPPVALLLGPMTGSAAELLVLGFRGRPHARSFGELTAGVPTATDTKRLGDGANLALTVALGTDRMGRTYEGPLFPDQEVKIDWTQIGTDDDPVLQVAVQWLRTEEHCV